MDKSVNAQDRVDLRAASPAVRAGVLALNAAVEVETSPLDPARLGAMLAQATFAEARLDGDGQVLAFLIAFAPGAAYDNPNFRWFRERMHGFAYVDRIVVAEAGRGRGLARALYEALFAHARAAGLADVVCEVNVSPPNPGSDAFHAALGFAEVGRADLPNGKRVRYLRLPVSASSPAT